jgi:hypothetical protein
MLLAVMLILWLQAPPDGGGVFYSYVDGMRWAFAVCAVDVDRSPRWDDSEDAPPLPPRAAVRSARELLRKYVERADDWELAKVSVQPIAGRSDVWVYLVDFNKPLPPLPDHPGEGVAGSILRSAVSVVVMMDGTAITPQRQPWRP